jgi:imidazolonepropionase-like amidohydrolase
MARRINSMWVENVGRHLMWLPPDQVANHVREYINKGINFIKYGSNDHYPGSFLAFSPEVQSAIVNEARRAGITAQAHTMSVEGLRVAIEAGCDLIQHANVTGPVPIPESTLELIAKKKTGAVVFPWTERGFEWILQNVNDMERNMWLASDANARNLIRCGATLLLANDGAIFAPEKLTTQSLNKSWGAAPVEDGLISLSEGHFVWFRAMEEKGCKPMDMLRAATRNIAVAYGKDKDLGTLEPGKLADLLILDRNPLQAAENYRSIHSIMKEGSFVDREALPLNPVLTRPMDPPAEEEASYVPFITPRRVVPHICPTCMRG